MRNFKILIASKMKGLYSIRLEKLENDKYYGLIAEEMDMNSMQFIVTSEVIEEMHKIIR